jgi:hypothetical protein
MLSVVAVAMAGLAFVATRDADQPAERLVTTSSTPTETSSPKVKPPKQRQPAKPKQPKIKRGETYVEVYNNSGITGLAGRVGAKATDIGWQVVGTDNWMGTIPSSTVYYPPRLKEEAEQLALDLGLSRTMPAVGAMRRDRLTVVLTADAAS